MSTTAAPNRSHVKRPMNSFMVWSREKRCEILKKHPGINNAVVSKTLGAAWKNLTEEEKKPYVYEAQRLAEQHRDDHPEYKYRPRRKKSRVKSIKSEDEMPLKPLVMHSSPPQAPCMCQAHKPATDYPGLTRFQAPSNYPYPPFYGYPSPVCCPHDVLPYREKSSYEAFIEHQEALRHSPAPYYSRDYESKYSDAYKPPCTLGCCSPTEEYLRYIRYANASKEAMSR